MVTFTLTLINGCSKLIRITGEKHSCGEPSEVILRDIYEGHLVIKQSLWEETFEIFLKQQ